MQAGTLLEHVFDHNLNVTDFSVKIAKQEGKFLLLTQTLQEV